jgi:WW domain
MPVVTLAAAAALASGTMQAVGFVASAWDIYDKISDGEVITDEAKDALRLSIESLDEIKEELEATNDVFEANTAAFTVELQHLREVHARVNESREQAHADAITILRQAHADAITNLRQAHVDEITNLRQAHADEITNLRQAHVDAITILRQAHADAITNLRKAHSDNTANLERSLTQAHEAATARLTQAHEAATARLTQAHEAATAILTQAHEAATAILTQAHKHEIRRVQKDLQSVPSDSRDKKHQRPEVDTSESLRPSKIAATAECLPPGWEMGFSKTQKRVYYFNPSTRASTWEKPDTDASVTTTVPDPRSGLRDPSDDDDIGTAG